MGMLVLKDMFKVHFWKIHITKKCYYTIFKIEMREKVGIFANNFLFP